MRNDRRVQRMGALLTAFLSVGFLVGIYWYQRVNAAASSITSTSVAFTENFDGIGNSATATLPAGWRVDSAAQTTVYASAATTTTQAAGTTGTGAINGSSSGGSYNFANGVTATSTDRSVGWLGAGSFASPRQLFLEITNNTGVTVDSLDIAYDIEKYRSGTRAWDINFFTSTDGTTWTAQTAGDQSYAADANNTTVFNPPSTISKSFTITGLSIANGGNFYLRWSYTGVGGSTNGQGLGIDNFSVTANVTVPTAVRLTKFNGVSFADGVQLTWESGYEVNNLGYHVYSEQNGKRTRVSPALIAGSALTVGQGNKLTAGYSYSWFDPNGTSSSLYYLEAIDLDGSRQVHGPLYPYAMRGKDSPRHERALLLNELAGASSAGKREAEISYPASMSAARDSDRGNSARVGPQSLGTQQEIAAGKAIKISVGRSGWYRVTQSELLAAGLDAAADARRLQLYVDGEEVPIRLSTETRLGPGDTLEFYGNALNSPTSDERVYYLVNATTAGKRITVKRAKVKQGDMNWTDSATAGSFAHTVERKEKLLYSSHLLNGDAENIFGAPVLSEPVSQTVLVRNFDVQSLQQSQLEVELQGLTQRVHRVRVQFNGEEIGNLDFGASDHPVASFGINRGLVHDGENTVTLVSTNGESDISFIDSIRLSYPHKYAADDNRLEFSVTGNDFVRVDGFTSANIRVVDITNPNAPQELPTVAGHSDSGYAVKVQPIGGGQRTLLAFTDDLVNQASSITTNRPSSWKARENGADLVIVTHKNFLSAIEPLAAQRRNEGLSVAVVDVEDVYDEFSFGAHTPAAIKSFLMTAASNWIRKPHYLLLVGDSSWDPKNYLDQGDNDFVPTKLIDTSYMETSSDDWLVDFSSTGLPQMAVGRLPGRTSAEISLIVSKILSYQQERETTAPLRGAVMVADTDFEETSSQTRNLLPVELTVESINRSQVGSDDVMRGAILDALDRGPMLVNYYGHGSVRVWTGAGILDADLATNLSNVNRSSLFVLMTCLNGYASDAYIDSLSESVLKAPNGGAVAVWASSGFTDSSPQFKMNTEFYRLLFGSTSMRLGDAARDAKAATSDMDVRRTWMLFGDPTMRLR